MESQQMAKDETKKFKEIIRIKANFHGSFYCLCALMMAVIFVLNSQSMAAGLLKSNRTQDENQIFLQSHHVKVTINNGFARTEVDQVFGNRGSDDLQAIYSFPLPDQASLSELSLWIDGKEIVGEVLEKERARQVHDEQIQKGNDTALAEKDDYRVFEVSVYPVRANNTTRVRLVYYQPLMIDLNVGRYLYPLAEGGVDEERIAFWSVDDKVEASFRFELELKSAFPIKDVRAPQWMDVATVKKITDKERADGTSEHYILSIEQPEGGNLSKDILVYYRLDDSVPARIEIIPYREDASSVGTFMAIVTPAADLKPITEGVDWIFVLDASGSMGGDKISTLIDGVVKVIGQMSSKDRYRIITFNNRAADLTGGFIAATPENVQSSLNQIRNIRANGGTNLYDGIKLAYDRLDDDRTTGIILVTDGVANIGPTGHDQFIKLLRQYDIRLFTFVMGNSANQPLMETLAQESGGFAMNVGVTDDIIGRIIQAKAKILYENLHDVTLTFHGEKVSDLTPAKPGNLYQGQQLVVFGHYKSEGKVELELNAKISGQEHSWRCRADLPAVDQDNPELERLWALSRVDEIMQKIRQDGESEGLRQKVIELGEAYSLVTDYTSMLVLSEEEKESQGTQNRNRDRVERERQAQARKENQAIRNHRVDQDRNDPSGRNGAFGDRSSPGIGFGSGPVGPLFVVLAIWMKRKQAKV